MDNSELDDRRNSGAEYLQIQPKFATRRGINSTFTSVGAPGVCVVSPLEQIKKTAVSTPNLNTNRVAAMLSTESSDSGAVTFSDGDAKKSLRFGINVKRNHPYCRITSSENANSEQQSVLESPPSSQDDEYFFMPKKMHPKSFDVLKDIVMMERTAVFDLRILAEDFHQIFPEKAFSSGRALVDLFAELKYLQRFHNDHLSTLEVLMKNWENCLESKNVERPRIGDVLLCSVHNALQHYRKFVQYSPIYLAAVDELTRTNSTFADSLSILQERDSYSCNINFLILKVLHQMNVWQNVLGRMVAALLEESNEIETASQLSSCRVAMEKVASFNAEMKPTLEGLVHFTKFVELANDLNIIDGLTDPNRRFIRQGWLCKWTKRGFIPHIVILFNDALLFAHRSQPNGFVRNAFLPLRSMTVEQGDAFHVVTDPTVCLTVHAVNRTFVLSGDCTRVRDLWLEELSRAVQAAKNAGIESLPQTETFVITEASFEDEYAQCNGGGVTDSNKLLASETKTVAPAASSTLNICWYRHATLGINAIIAAPANQMSGYLWRKFRNSTGWQKLWVVHANFTLIFFRSHQEREAIAMLPTISYHISLPQLNDKIDSENVFKLSYKTHCYFFRTDSLYAFSKWYECIRESTINSSPLDVIAGFSSR